MSARKRCRLMAVAVGVVLFMALPAVSAPRTQTLDIHERSMAKALAELAREASAELLFDQKLVRSLEARPVRGRLSVEAALAALLAGTGIGYRVTPDGAFVLFAQSVPKTAVTDSGDGAVAELLVIGRRSQNTDIRRTGNDIQPYKVATRQDIATAHRDNLDQFLRGREPANVQIVPPAQDPIARLGAARSEVDLRGFGSQRTLVLVDGRRMPSLPSTQGEFDQTDLNGIPLGAVERIETLTSTAGGIHGPSAIGGVVNVILRRDYRGAEFNITSGITDRGDTGRLRTEARLGFTPDGGTTDVMLFGAYAVSQPLRVGQRDYMQRSRALQYANDPVAYVGQRVIENAVNIYSANGGDLTLGSASIGSSHTYLPLNFTGSAADRSAALLANSGQLSLTLPNDQSGTQRYLVTNPTVVSGIFSVRRRVGDSLELFADGLFLRNAGRSTSAGLPFPALIRADAPDNPFSQLISVTAPLPGLRDEILNRTDVSRLTLGLIATLPRRWKGSVDLTVGGASVEQKAAAHAMPNIFTFNLRTGGSGPGALPPLDPLGDWPTFVAASEAYIEPEDIAFHLENHFTDATLRLAGPVAALPGGELKLTTLAEQRREYIPATVATFRGPALDLDITLPRRTRIVRSGYAELRAPLAPLDAHAIVLRGLELQVAVRYDHTSTTLPENGTFITPSNDRLITLRRHGLVYTAGARIFPTSRLMLRTSVATGELPPNISQLQAGIQLITTDQLSAPDPQRGGRHVGAEGPVSLIMFGSHTVRPEEGRTLSVGAVLNPSGEGGPRLSIDYSRTLTLGQIINFPLTPAQLVLAEATYPDRVLREPLTSADAAQGFTAGRIIQLDTAVMNAGRTVVEAVDITLDWRLPAGHAGDFRIYGSATWQPSFRRQDGPGKPFIERVGYIDGLLAWRGNMGLEWTRGPLSFDLNAQYYDSFRVVHADPSYSLNSQLLRFQGAARIPRQIYVDLAVGRRFEISGGLGPLREVGFRLGIQNLFDTSPPITVETNGPGYSTYGDPRRRRAELVISSQF